MKNLEYLLGLAAVNDDFTKALAKNPAAAAAACGMTLSAAERSILDTADAARLQLLAAPVAVSIPAPERRRFLAQATGALATLAAGGALLAGSPDEATASPASTGEIQPWWNTELAGGGSGGSGGGRITGVRPSRPGQSKEAPPLVRLGHVRVHGKLHRRVAQRIVRRYLPYFKYAYRAELARTHKIAGVMGVSLQIERHGKIASVKIVNDTVKHAKLKKRITSRLRRMRFPNPKPDPRRSPPNSAEIRFTLTFIQK